MLNFFVTRKTELDWLKKPPQDFGPINNSNTIKNKIKKLGIEMGHYSHESKAIDSRYYVVNIAFVTVTCLSHLRISM